MSKRSGMDRRSFIKTSATATLAACNIFPDYAVGKTEQNSKLNLAIIGCAYQGRGIGRTALGHDFTNCAALCDVVPALAESFKSEHKDAPVFDDFRKIFDEVGDKPPHPEVLEEDREVPSCGKVIYGDDLTFMGGTHSSTLRVIPESKMREIAPELPRIPDSETSRNHMTNFLRAARGDDPYCNSSFEVTAPLSQVFSLGCIAQRLGETLRFDAENMRITNNDAADQLLRGPEPSDEWKQYYRLA